MSWKKQSLYASYQLVDTLINCSTDYLKFRSASGIDRFTTSINTRLTKMDGGTPANIYIYITWIFGFFTGITMLGLTRSLIFTSDCNCQKESVTGIRDHALPCFSKIMLHYCIIFKWKIDIWSWTWTSRHDCIR